MTPQESAASYAELGVPELVKKVNEVYEQIHLHARADYPRAVMIGEMLNDIRPRVAKHGAWQNWLKANCPKISYETANVYMRIATKQMVILNEAGRKNVAATDLTIALARELLTKPKKAAETDTTAAASYSESDDEAGDSDGDAETDDDSDVDYDDKGVNVDAIFTTLTTRYADDKDGLKALTKKLGEYLGLRVWEPTLPRSTDEHKIH